MENNLMSCSNTLEELYWTSSENCELIELSSTKTFTYFYPLVRYGHSKTIIKSNATFINRTAECRHARNILKI